MDEYVFEDVLTASTVTCVNPVSTATVEAGESRTCESIFFPGCSLINYALPLVQAVYDLLKKAGEVDGMSMLCCGKILSFEPDGKAVRASFEEQLRDHVHEHGVKRIIAACPNCTTALRDALQEDERTVEVEIVPLPKVLAQLGYRIDAGVARRLLAQAVGADPASDAVQALTFCPHDSCPDRKTGEYADGLRALMPAELVVEGKHHHKGSRCCGSLVRAAGHYDLADKQARERGEDAQGAGAAALVTACVSCTFQMTMAQCGVPVFHYLELLFDWRIDWQSAGMYMKLRFLFDEPARDEDDARPFMGLNA